MFNKCLTPKFITIRSYMQQKEPQTSTIQFKRVLSTLTASDTCVFTVAPSAPSASVHFRRIPMLPMHAAAPDTSLCLCRLCRFHLCRFRLCRIYRLRICHPLRCHHYHCCIRLRIRRICHLRRSASAAFFAASASASDASASDKKTTCSQLVQDMDLLSDRTVSAVSYRYPDGDGSRRRSWWNER
jgi:hypothetical protein